MELLTSENKDDALIEDDFEDCVILEVEEKKAVYKCLGKGCLLYLFSVIVTIILLMYGVD